MKQGTAIAHRSLVHDAVDRIQRELDDEVSLDLLAESAGVSPFHFHRVFSSVVGEAPAGYMRRLRLERAAIRLKYTQRPVTDIAFDAGYETHESFTRAFKARFGHAPRRFRSEEACSDTELQDPIQIVRLPTRRIACARYIGPYQEVGEAFNRVLEWAEWLEPRAARGPEVGCDLLGSPVDHAARSHSLRCGSLRGRALRAAGAERGRHRSARASGRRARGAPLPGSEVTEERGASTTSSMVSGFPNADACRTTVPPYEEYIPPGGDLERLDEITKVHVRLAPGRAA